LVDNDFEVNNENPLKFLTDITRRKKLLKKDFFYFTDLGRVTQDTRHFITNLKILHPFITNFLADKFVQVEKHILDIFQQFTINNILVL
jgi:hypothetical protein